MDKPISVPVKDYLMKVMSVRMNIPLKAIEAVVEHQLQEANEAMATNNSVELSGFGKFLFNTKKAIKMTAGLERALGEWREQLLTDLTEQKRKKIMEKVRLAEVWMKTIKPRITNETERSVRRVEEQSVSPSPLEGSGKEGGGGEDGNLPTMPSVF